MASERTVSVAAQNTPHTVTRRGTCIIKCNCWNMHGEREDRGDGECKRASDSNRVRPWLTDPFSRKPSFRLVNSIAVQVLSLDILHYKLCVQQRNRLSRACFSHRRRHSVSRRHLRLLNTLVSHFLPYFTVF